MQSRRKLSELLTELAIDPFIGHVAEELLTLARAHGDPLLPEGPRAPIDDPHVPLRTRETIGDWGGEEQAMAECYNAGLIRLLAVLDMHRAPGGEWVMTHPCGEIPDSFKAFSEDAFPIIEKFVTETAWDYFLKSYL